MHSVPVPLSGAALRLVEAGLSEAGARMFDADVDQGMPAGEAARMVSFEVDELTRARVVAVAERHAPAAARRAPAAAPAVPVVSVVVSDSEASVRAQVASAYDLEHGSGGQEYARCLVETIREAVVKAGGGRREFEERLRGHVAWRQGQARAATAGSSRTVATSEARGGRRRVMISEPARIEVIR